jgi:hypothetical protein
MAQVTNREKLAKKIGLTMEDLEDLFSYFDADGSGSVEPDEFGILLAACGLPLEEHLLAAIVKQIDADHDGKISFDEFADFFVARDWGFDPEKMTEADNIRFATGRREEASGDFSWDFGASFDDNVAALNAAKRDVMNTGVEDSEDAAQLLHRHREMLRIKLMIPLIVKKAVRHINACGAHDPAGRSQNSVTVQVGETEADKNYVEAYFKPTSAEDFASFKPPNESVGVAGAIDFALRDDATEEQMAKLAEKVNQMFHETVLPIIRWAVAHIPKELQRTGMINGPVFDSIKFGVVEVDGTKCFRISGFSGVDLTALIKDLIADIQHVLPEVSLKVSTGFGLSDLTSEGATPLRDMLNAKTELNVAWHVKMSELAARVYRDVALQSCSSYERKKIRIVMAEMIAGWKFFQAQRSLVFFQFESLFHVVGEMIKAIGLPELFHKLEKVTEREGTGPLLDAPPSLELVDAVLDAIGSISGKTFGNLRKHFLADVHVEGKRGNKLLGHLKATIQKDLVERLHKRLSGGRSPFDEECNALRWGLEGLALYFQAQETLAGLKGFNVSGKIFQAGLNFRGLGEIFKLLPSKAEYDAAKVNNKSEQTYEARRHPVPWVVKYAKFLQSYLDPSSDEPCQPQRPTDDYLNELREDFSEIIDIVQAALPYLDAVQKDNFPIPNFPALYDKAEKEAKWMFGMIDEDVATAAWDQAVADGYEAPQDEPKEDYRSKYADDEKTADEPFLVEECEKMPVPSSINAVRVEVRQVAMEPVPMHDWGECEQL